MIKKMVLSMILALICAVAAQAAEQQTFNLLYSGNMKGELRPIVV